MSPFSPLSRLRCSSASVRIFPPPRTSQGANAIPITEFRRGKRLKFVNEFTFTSDHWNNIPLKISLEDVPGPLIDNEGGLASQASIGVGFGYNPSRSIRNTLVRSGTV